MVVANFVLNILWTQTSLEMISYFVGITFWSFRPGVHNIRPAEAFYLARKAQNFTFQLVCLKKHPLNGYKNINSGPWICSQIFFGPLEIWVVHPCSRVSLYPGWESLTETLLVELTQCWTHHFLTRHLCYRHCVHSDVNFFRLMFPFFLFFESVCSFLEWKISPVFFVQF